MAMRVSLTATGWSDIDARLKKLPAKIEKRILRKAMREAFKHTLRNVKARIPKGSRGVPHLVSALKLRKNKTFGKGGVVFGIFIDKAKLDPKHFVVASPPTKGKRRKGPGFYPSHLELGYTDPSGKRHVGIGYMRKGLRATRKNVQKTLERLLWQGIRGELVKMT